MTAARLSALVLALSTAAALASPYDEPATVWVAGEFAGATLIFAAPGQLGGQAPCNLYGGNQTAAWPDFRAEDIFSTKMACDALGLEIAYFQALERAIRAEIVEGALVLSDETGPLLSFTRAE